MEALDDMHASRSIPFIMLTGILFGMAAAGMSWINDASIGLTLLAYIAGGNVGVSLAAAWLYLHPATHTDD
ncbi:MAG: hypothetical protein AAFO72_11235 [Pseudomonadota bacterium]